MLFYGISFMHPYKQSGRWKDVLSLTAVTFKTRISFLFSNFYLLYPIIGLDLGLN